MRSFPRRRWFSASAISSPLAAPAGASHIQSLPPSLDALKHRQQLKHALDFLHKNPNVRHTYFYARILRNCCRLRSLEDGRKAHRLIMASGLDRHRFLNNLLIDMYGKCGSLDDARKIFDTMQQKDVVSWTSLIGACSKHGREKEALVLFKQMVREGFHPNEVTYISVLNACKDETDLKDGKLIHKCLRNSEAAFDVVVSTSLVSMYGRCGSSEDARVVFDGMTDRNVVSWTAIIAAYSNQGKNFSAFQIFAKMQLEGMKADKVTWLTILNACASPAFLREGALIHSQIVDCGLGFDLVVANSIVSMYAKCGDLEGVKRMFHMMKGKDLVTWNVVVAAFSQHGDAGMALKYFRQMQIEGFKPDRVTLVSIINACAIPEFLPDGKLIHAYVREHGFDLDASIGSALVNMYGKCGRLLDAQSLFDEILEGNRIGSFICGDSNGAQTQFRSSLQLLWNVMIALYTQHKKLEDALQLFSQMQTDGVQPDRVTYVGILDACGELASLQVGKSIHQKMIDTGFDPDVVVATALVNMYRKCGSLDDAGKIFNLMQERNLITWTAMIAAYAQHGNGKEALKLFSQLQWIGFEPNKVGLVNVLSACSHAGLVEEGFRYSTSFKAHHRHPSSFEQYDCELDLFGRAGNLGEAEICIANVQFQLNPVI